MASNPGGWLIAIIFFLLGEWFSNQTFPINESIICIISVSLIGSSAAYLNNVYDRELDVSSGKKKVWVFKYIKPEYIMYLSIVFSIIGAIILLYINIFVFILGILLILMSIVYSAPPLRLKTVPPFDSIPNGIGVGTFPFLIGWLVADNNLTILPIIYSLIFGIMSLSGYFYYTAIDIENDAACGIQTSCTKIGVKKSMYLGIILFLFSFVLSIIYFGVFSFVTLSFLILFPPYMIPFVKKDILYPKMKKDLIYLIESLLFSIWTIFILVILFISSVSIIPIIVLIMVLLYTASFMLVYRKINIMLARNSL